MKHWLKLFVFSAMALVASQALAIDELPHDTVYFYRTWEQMLDLTPEGMLIDPLIEAYTPYQIVIETGDEDINNNIYKSYVAATLGDSIWLINTQYIKNTFKGDVKKLDKFAPVYFNDKVAFFMYVGYGENVSWKDILFGDWIDFNYEEMVDYYYIDFKNQKVVKITPESLSALLEDYHDLQMRYEGMKDYKKRYIINDYFNKFIERATQDFMHPYILDLVN